MQIVTQFNVLQAMDPKWMAHKTRMTTEYAQGVKEFMGFTIAHKNPAEVMWCPCRNYNNLMLYPTEEIDTHASINGMSTTYTR